MAFKYRERSTQAWEKRATASSDFANVFNTDYKEYQVRKGDNYVRILPPTWEGAEHYGLDIFIHYNVGPDRTQVLCLYKMADLAKALGKDEFAHGRCPICEAKAKFDRSGDKEAADELRWSKRVAVWMVDLKERDAGPQVWSIAQSLDVNICKLARDPRTGEIALIDHPYEGYGLSFEKEGEQLKTKYVALRLDSKPSSIDQDFLDFIDALPLPEVLNWRSYEQLQQMYAGASGAGAEARAEERPAREPREEASNRREEPAPREALRERGTRREPPPAEPKEDPSLAADREHLRDPKPEEKEPEKPAASGATMSAKEKLEQIRARFKDKK